MNADLSKNSSPGVLVDAVGNRALMYIITIMDAFRHEKVYGTHPSSKIVAPRVSYRLSQPRLALGTLYTRVGAYLLTQTTLASRFDGDAQMVVRSNPGDRSRVTDYGYDRFQGNFLHTLSIQP